MYASKALPSGITTASTSCSYIDASDDAICLKSHSAKKLCQNIEVRHCTARSSASGIKFGTMGAGGFKNVRIINNNVYDTYRSAITIQSVDGGICENILVDSLYATNVGNAIYLNIGARRDKQSYMDGITIRNLYCEVAATKPDAGYEYEGPIEDLPRNISPCGIIGLKDSKIKNVTLENIEIVFPGGGDPHYAHVGLDELDKVPEMPKAYPEFSQHMELPAWGFFIRHVDGLTMHNIKLTALKKDYRTAIVMDDVSNHNISNLFLPKQVPENGGGEFFSVEHYYLEPSHYAVLREQFSDILLKLYCYYDLRLFIDDDTEGIFNPDSKLLASHIMDNQSNLCMLLGASEALITLGRDNTNLTVYAPSENLLELIRMLAGAVGLFVWKPKQL